MNGGDSIKGRLKHRSSLTIYTFQEVHKITWIYNLVMMTLFTEVMMMVLFIVQVMLMIFCQKCDDPNSLRFPAGFLLIIQWKGTTARANDTFGKEKYCVALNNALNEWLWWYLRMQLSNSPVSAHHRLTSGARGDTTPKGVLKAVSKGGLTI